MLTLSLLTVRLEAQDFPSSGKKRQEKVLPTFVGNPSAIVPRSGEVRIPLKAIPNLMSEVRFEIVNTPKHGTLSPIVPLGEHDAVVTYRHDGSRTASTDEFTFRAQATGRSKSTPGTVGIVIVPPPPCLSISPERINFGEQVLGDVTRKSLRLSNTGGGRAAGRLVLPKGFSAPDGDRFNLDEGEGVNLTVEFRPMESVDYSGEGASQPFLGGEHVLLQGVGMPRFKVDQLGPSEWKITNHTGQKLRMEIDRGEEWGLPKEITLPPGTPKKLLLIPKAASEGSPPPPKSVNISDGLTSVEMQTPQIRLTPFIPVTVESVAPDSPLSTTLGRSVPLRFRLGNASDSPRPLVWSISSKWGGGTDQPAQVVLEPGETKVVCHDWLPSVPGEALVKATVREGGGPPKELTWIIPVATSARTSDTPSIFHHSAEEAPRESPAIPESVADATSQQRLVVIPPVEGISWEVKRSFFGRQSLVITHSMAPHGAGAIKLEQLAPITPRDFHSGKAMPGNQALFASKLDALPIQGFRVVKKGARESIIVDRVFPGLHELRLSFYGDNQYFPLAASGLEVSVSRYAPWWLNWKVWVGVILGVLVIRWVRSRRVDE